MKALKRMLLIFLSILLIMTCFEAAAANSIILTAVNDQLLPLSSNTMPTRKNGEYYVPYTVFSGTLGVRTSYDSKQQMLTMSKSSQTLTFLIAQSYVYDQDMKSYSSPAYRINNSIYVPVKLTCSKFGCSFSLLSGDEPIVRICNDDVVLSDTTFLSSSSATIRQMLDKYNRKPTVSTPQQAETPSTTPSGTQTSEAVIKPSLVYLTFWGAPNKNTDAILDTLPNGSAAFFLPVEESMDGDFVRSIAAKQHTFGLYITDFDESNLPEKLRKANDALFCETGLTTRLVGVQGGVNRLSEQARTACINAGYRFWDAELDSRDTALSSAGAARRVTTTFAKTSSPTVVRFGFESTTAGAVRTVLQYIRSNDISTAVVSVTRVPINAAGDLR